MNTARKQRIAWILLLLLGVAVAAALATAAFRENLMYFHTPTDITAGTTPGAVSFRLGGVVQEGSVRRESGSLAVRFVLADCDHAVTVFYDGILPDLFREGQGIVTTGRLDDSGEFIASQVLAKHDENYMPPELEKRLTSDTGHRCDAFRPVQARAAGAY